MACASFTLLGRRRGRSTRDRMVPPTQPPLSPSWGRVPATTASIRRMVAAQSADLSALAATNARLCQEAAGPRGRAVAMRRLEGNVRLKVNSLWLNYPRQQTPLPLWVSLGLPRALVHRRSGMPFHRALFNEAPGHRAASALAGSALISLSHRFLLSIRPRSIRQRKLFVFMWRNVAGDVPRG